MIRKLLLVCLLLTGSATADSLLDGQGVDLSGLRPIQVGELVTVVITDRVTTRQQVTVQSQSQSSMDLPIGKGLLEAFLGAGLNSKGQRQRQEGANTQSEFEYTVTAKVVAIDPGNVLRLQASSSIEIDGKLRQLEMTGRVRRQDLGPTNTVPSDRLAEAEVKVDGAQASPSGGGFGIFDYLLAPLRSL